MSTGRLVGIGLLVLGLILLFFGFNAANSPGEEIAEAFTGSYSDRTMAYLIGGGVMAVVGLVLTLRR